MVHLFATLPLSVSNCQLVGFFEISSSLCCWCAATLSKCCGWSFYLHPSYGLHAMHIAVNIQTPCSVSTSEIATETSNLPELHSRFPGLWCRSTNYVKDLKDANHQCGVPVLTQFALAARAGCERSCQPKTCIVMSKCSAKATNWVKACWNTEAPAKHLTCVLGCSQVKHVRVWFMHIFSLLRTTWNVICQWKKHIDWCTSKEDHRRI